MCSLNLGIIFSYKNKLQLGNLEENSSELYLVSLIIKFRILTLIQLKDYLFIYNSRWLVPFKDTACIFNYKFK